MALLIGINQEVRERERERIRDRMREVEIERGMRERARVSGYTIALTLQRVQNLSFRCRSERGN